MALGDFVAKPTIAGSLTVAVTFVCTNCATSNTTPQVTKPLLPDSGAAATMYGRVTCTNCGHAFLIAAEAATVSVRVQQVS